MDKFGDWQEEYHLEVEGVINSEREAKSKNANQTDAAKNSPAGEIVNLVIPAVENHQSMATQQHLKEAQEKIVGLELRCRQLEENSTDDKMQIERLKNALANIAVATKKVMFELEQEKIKSAEFEKELKVQTLSMSERIASLKIEIDKRVAAVLAEHHAEFVLKSMKPLELSERSKII